MSHYVSDPPAKIVVSAPEPVADLTPVPEPTRPRYIRVGFISLFVLIGLSLLLFSGQILLSLTQTSPVSAAHFVAQTPRATGTVTSISTPVNIPTPTPSVPIPFLAPNNALMEPLQLPGGHYVLYQDQTHMYLASTTDKSILPLYTPGYTYNQAVRPLLTPDGRLIYSGAQGIWQTELFDQQPFQMAILEANTLITSLALSQDGKMIAWTTEPSDASGQIKTYAGPLDNPQLVRKQSALECPCLRIFSFLNGSGSAADTTLLLTDDRGSSSAVQYGLWSLDLSTPSADPTTLLNENTQQGPLVFAPYSTTLLYAPYEGGVPVPTDGSVPADVAALSYANSLSIGTLSGTKRLSPDTSQVVLKSQKGQTVSPQSSWITTPTFSPDGQTLAYVEFSTDPQGPYDRHSALYTVQITGSGNAIHIGTPQLISISTTRLVELGAWLNSHVITLYSDGGIYALDVQSGALLLLLQASSGHYMRVLATVGVGQT